MTEESKVQLELRGGESALILSRARSGIVARGRKDAAKLLARTEPGTPVPLSKSRVKKLADLGNPEAQWEVGCVYREGGHTPYGVWSTDEEVTLEGPADYRRGRTLVPKGRWTGP